MLAAFLFGTPFFMVVTAKVCAGVGAVAAIGYGLKKKFGKK